MVEKRIFSYEAFNLNFISKNLDLPDLKKVEDSSKECVFIQEENSALWPDLPHNRYETFFLKMTTNDFRLKVEGVGKFRVYKGKYISWERENSSTRDQDLRTFLLGSVIGALLIQRGILVFHGNALFKNKNCILCIGHSGHGKSTLAYSLIQNGWELLADDLVAISQEMEVLPGIPTIKLWEDSAKAFNIDIQNLNQIRQGVNKYIYHPEKNKNSFSTSQKLKTIYLLRESHKVSKKASNSFEIIPINSQQRATLILRNHCYRPRFIRGLGMEGKYFLRLVELQKKITLKTLDLPDGIKEMQKSISEHF